MDHKHAQDTGSSPTWDEVLATFSAQMDHVEALLEAPVGELPTPPAQSVIPDTVSYDTWTGPSAMAAQLHQGALALHVRQRELISRLQDAMATVRLQQQLLDAPAAVRRPAFVDQLA